MNNVVMDEKVFDDLFKDVNMYAGVYLETGGNTGAINIIVKTKSGSSYKIASVKNTPGGGSTTKKSFEARYYGLLIYTNIVATIPWSEIAELYTDRQKKYQK
mgnify:CR=1 FL=1